LFGHCIYDEGFMLRGTLAAGRTDLALFTHRLAWAAALLRGPDGPALWSTRCGARPPLGASHRTGRTSRRTWRTFPLRTPELSCGEPTGAAKLTPARWRWWCRLDGRCAATGARRPGQHGYQRALSYGDYHLTGKITCPACGRKYIGTSATGRNRTYRYYTCFSRTRYGTHGCQAARLPADQADTAVLHALCDFYANATNLIEDAITRARARHRDGHTDRRAEHGAILAQIKAKEAAIERYHLAFENGTMDDATAGERLKVLRGEIAQLTARAADLADAMGSEPAAPPPGTIERLHTYLADTIASGTTAER